MADNQKIKLGEAYKEKSAITLRFKMSQLNGNHEMLLTRNQINKLQK